MNTLIKISRALFSYDSYIDAVFHGAKIHVDESIYEQLKFVRSKLNELFEQGETIYGVNTGLGALASKKLDEEEVQLFQLNTLRSHSVGVGDFAPIEVSRGALLLRIVSLSKGRSGIRSGLLKLLVSFFNSGATPVIPMRGSVGASGDLSPLSHLSLAVIGDERGGVIYRGKIYTGNDLRRVLLEEIYKDVLSDPDVKEMINFNGDSPLVKLSFKESLALNNGTSFSASLALYVVYKLEKLLRIADANVALMLEALNGIIDSFDERFFEIGDPRYEHPALDTVATVRGILEGTDGSKLVVSRNKTLNLSDISRIELKDDFVVLKFDERAVIKFGIKNKLEALINIIEKRMNCFREYSSKSGLVFYMKCVDESALDKLRDFTVKFSDIGFVQDAYSLRCSPQVHGAVRRGIHVAKTILIDEINIPNDNPLFFLEENGRIDVLSGGNFHGQSIALATENLALAITYLANISERRLFRVLDPNLNNGLPPFLATKPGLESGFMISQYLVADLLAELRQLASPPSVHSIPTSANQEDVVSMSATSAMRLLRMIELLEYILVIEQLTALQGIALRLGWPNNQNNFEGASSLARKLIKYYDNVLAEVGGFPIHGDRVLSVYFEEARKHIYEVQEKFL